MLLRWTCDHLPGILEMEMEMGMDMDMDMRRELGNDYMR